MAKNVETVGIIGAGQMGTGIAHVFALTGYDVRVSDISEEQLGKMVKRIEKDMDRQLKREVITEDDMKTAMGRIKTGTDMSIFGDCDLVIEAATENQDLKVKIFGALCEHLNDDCIVVTNTSSISVTRLGAATDRPGKFMGMHFMNPVPRMELVEIIRGIPTEEETFNTIKEVTISLGKVPVVAEDFPAFVVNRILVPMLNEAVYVLYEGVGSVESIDNAMRLGAHHPMGPLTLMDFIGLDTCLAVMNVLHEGMADTKYRPCPLLVKYVEAGWLGRKTGRGFYDYSGEKPVPTR